MQVSLESLSGLERRLTVRLPAARVEEEFDGRLRRTARKAKIPGFRPGRATLDAVRQRYGAGIRREVVDDMVQESLQEALRDKQLQLAGRPRIESCDDSGSGLEYAAVFEIWPELRKFEWRGLKVERGAAAVEEQDVDRALERLRLHRAEWSETQRGAQDDDRVRFHYQLSDAQGKTQLKNEDLQARLGAGMLPAAMEQQLRGMKAGESAEYRDEFPATWREPELRGQPAAARLEVQSVEEPRPPELDQEFFAAFGVEEGGEAELRRRLREQLEQRLEQAIQDDLKAQVMEGLTERCADLPLPRAAVGAELARLRGLAGAPPAAADQGADGAEGAEEDPALTREAERRVRLGLALSEMTRVLELKADPEEVRALIEREAASYQEPQELIRWYYSNREALQRVESAALEKQLVKRALEAAQLSEKTLSFRELVEKEEGP